jgi:tetratricopeptide (TPR) repeat protein
MTPHKIVSSYLLLLAIVIISCQTKPTPKQADLSGIDLLRGQITMCGGQQLGEVNFPVSCNAQSRDTFKLAISLLHSFEYEEAEKAFVKTIDLDPNCVMAYWGVAMSNFHSLWMQSGTAYLEKGEKILSVAQTLPKTEREQDYLDAIHVFYKDWKTIDRNKRKQLFEQKMEALYKKYPDDKEAAIFYALALNATADPTDKTYVNQKKAGQILETIFKDQPDHPGVAHYIIHTYDYPELAALALPTARRYAQIAPASAHAQHMPSHIFTRLGLWEESISSNINSTNSAVCYGQSINPDGHWDEELHGMDYLVYAYLQKGENEKSREQLDYLKSFKKVFPLTFKVAYAAAAIPSRMALENKNWKEAANLQPPSFELDWKSFPWQRSILHFARALGTVHIKDIKSAQHELDTLKSLHQELLNKGDKYQAGQVQIQITAAQAWIHFANGKKEEALSLMKEAAGMEYNTGKHSVTPGEVLPAGELLGDLLMELGRPQEALDAYEHDLKQHPNRFNGLYGAARAAKTIGDKQKAAHYFELLLLQTKNAGSSRPELEEARKFTGKAIG